MYSPTAAMKTAWYAFAAEHCRRHPVGDAIFMWPWVPLVLQSALLFHTPTRGPRWLLKDNARPLRAALAALVVPLLLHIALSFRNGDIKMLGYDGNSANFVIAVFALDLAFKAIEFGLVAHRPRLAHADAQAGGARPPQPFYFPHTKVPLFLEYVFSLRGAGWEWGVPSHAAYGLPKGKSPPTTRADPRTVAYIRARLRTILICLVLGDLVNNAVTSPTYLAAFDAYPHPLTAVNPLDASPSPQRRIATQGVLVLLLGAAVYAPIQGTFAFLSILSTLVSPATQTWWDPLPFDNPLFADSLTSLWGQRWHALFRRPWYFVGYLPASKLARAAGLGKAASRSLAVLATFLVSGLTHELGLHSLRRSRVLDAATGRVVNLTDAVQPDGSCYPLDATAPGWGAHRYATLFFFASQGVLLVVEQCFQMATGRKVGGTLGRVWLVLGIALTVRPMLRSWLMHEFVDGIQRSPLTRGLAHALVKAVVRVVGGVEVDDDV
ncbi:unnamed protein product [Parajaminaea phylloscopi]